MCVVVLLLGLHGFYTWLYFQPLVMASNRSVKDVDVHDGFK